MNKACMVCATKEEDTESPRNSSASAALPERLGRSGKRLYPVD